MVVEALSRYDPLEQTTIDRLRQITPPAKIKSAKDSGHFQPEPSTTSGRPSETLSMPYPRKTPEDSSPPADMNRNEANLL
jgi:hypothetical protein